MKKIYELITRQIKLAWASNRLGLDIGHSSRRFNLDHLVLIHSYCPICDVRLYLFI